MLQSLELPDCIYTNQNEAASLVCPSSPTPNHILYLSNLDDQKFLRFSIKYLYIFQKSISCEDLKWSLSRALVHYYPLAGRLRKTQLENDNDDQKLEVDCNAKGALFAEAFMDITAIELLQFCNKPNKSWRKLLYRVESAHSFLDVPPLIIQVTNLRCGGMILCTAINHCICDGAGSSQFLQAWAHMTGKRTPDPPIAPVHSRHALRPRGPTATTFSHPQFTRSPPPPAAADITRLLQSQPLAPASFTFDSAALLRLKRQCSPSLKCTAFEALASHTWRSWVRSLDLPASLPSVKLLFSVNLRQRCLASSLPAGYYGNAFVLACANSHLKDLLSPNLRHAVTCVQRAKSSVHPDDYLRSVLHLLDDKTVRTDLSASLVISQWAKLGLEDLDFGNGKPLHMGTITSDVYCLFLPVAGDIHAIRVLVSVPETVLPKFEFNMTNTTTLLDQDHLQHQGLINDNDFV